MNREKLELNAIRVHKMFITYALWAGSGTEQPFTIHFYGNLHLEVQTLATSPLEQSVHRHQPSPRSLGELILTIKGLTCPGERGNTFHHPFIQQHHKMFFKNHLINSREKRCQADCSTKTTLPAFTKLSVACY